MTAALFGPIAGALIGGLLSRDQQASASREPWGPAQPWLRDQIARGQALQDFYAQNPFSPTQQTAYQNLFSDIDLFRTGMLPNLLGIASAAATQPYERGVPSAPGQGMFARPQQQRAFTPVPIGGQQFGQIDWTYFDKLRDAQKKALEKQKESDAGLLGGVTGYDYAGGD